jgi:hypothetical protein
VLVGGETFSQRLGLDAHEDPLRMLGHARQDTTLTKHRAHENRP